MSADYTKLIFPNHANIGTFFWATVDHSVFYWKSGEEHTIVAVATDNMAVTSRRSVDAEHFKSNIKWFWDITDHGPTKWFLGFKIRRDCTSRTVSINQHAYIEAMVNKFRLTGAKKTLIPINPHTHYLMKQCPSTITQVAHMRGVLYCKVIRSILWLTVISRLDMAYAVGVLSQFMQNLGQAHWDAVKRVISYLGSTKELWLTFGGKGQVNLQGYCDSDWASQPHCHSISGFSFHYGQGSILWSSKKQGLITLSSTEAEYVAETHASKEGIWLKTFVREITGSPINPVTIKANNQGAIALAKDDKFYARTKHIDLCYHFVREAVEQGKIKMEYIPTSENIVDIFMKA